MASSDFKINVSVFILNFTMIFKHLSKQSGRCFARNIEWDILLWFSNIVVTYKMQCNTEKKISDILNGIFNL